MSAVKSANMAQILQSLQGMVRPPMQGAPGAGASMGNALGGGPSNINAQSAVAGMLGQSAAGGGGAPTPEAAAKPSAGVAVPPAAPAPAPAPAPTGQLPKLAGDRSMSKVPLPPAVRALIVKHAAARIKAASLAKFNSFIDGVCAKLPVEKTASFRVIQAGVANGLPLSHAIKIACPKLTPEGRGILAHKIVKAANATKSAEIIGTGAMTKPKKLESHSWSGPMKDGAKQLKKMS